MPIRNAREFTFKPHGVTDSLDATNAPPGSMMALQNLVCNPGTLNALVPRPAATEKADMADAFTTPTGITAIAVFGHLAYGFVSSADYAGKDVPFCYDLNAGAFIAISGLAAGLLPATQSTSGDWQPPTIDVFSNACVVFTHPGFSGAIKFGWLDISSFSITTLTGTTAIGSPTITAVSADPYLAGVEPGQLITGAGIPAGAYVLSTTATTITISANATAAAAGVALTITGGTPAAPLWGAGNTNGHGLASVPAAVSQFNGRAYYAVGNALIFSDALRPRQVTNASQGLILGDSEAVTALSATPFQAPLTGGVVTALLAFKGVASVWQVTGDQATSNLALNQINGSVGTLAPNTLASTPRGVAYVAPDGVRFIDLTGQCTDPLGEQGDGVRLPFWQSPAPSRMSAAFAHNVLRISLQDGSKANAPWVEYWYDFGRDAWTGPHTFASIFMVAFPNSPQTDWIAAPHDAPTKLFGLSAIPLPTSTYVENGAQMNWLFQPTLLPDNAAGEMNQIVQTTVALVLTTVQQVTVVAINESGTELDRAVIKGLSPVGGVWGSMIWGTGKWGPGGALRQYRIPWTQPLVFKQMSLQIAGASGPTTAIGNVYTALQVLGYMLDEGVQG